MRRKEEKFSFPLWNSFRVGTTATRLFHVPRPAFQIDANLDYFLRIVNPSAWRNELLKQNAKVNAVRISSGSQVAMKQARSESSFHARWVHGFNSCHDPHVSRNRKSMNLDCFFWKCNIKIPCCRYLLLVIFPWSLHCNKSTEQGASKAPIPFHFIISCERTFKII